MLRFVLPTLFSLTMFGASALWVYAAPYSTPAFGMTDGQVIAFALAMAGLHALMGCVVAALPFLPRKAA